MITVTFRWFPFCVLCFQEERYIHCAVCACYAEWIWFVYEYRSNSFRACLPLVWSVYLTWTWFLISIRTYLISCWDRVRAWMPGCMYVYEYGIQIYIKYTTCNFLAFVPHFCGSACIPCRLLATSTGSGIATLFLHFTCPVFPPRVQPSGPFLIFSSHLKFGLPLGMAPLTASSNSWRFIWLLTLLTTRPNVSAQLIYDCCNSQNFLDCLICDASRSLLPKHHLNILVPVCLFFPLRLFALHLSWPC